ncbi:MAG TPA: EamA family transporter, partial [Myxococcota bacterium]|nr:EamA family transporter [Myxococcota bacterium]
VAIAAALLGALLAARGRGTFPDARSARLALAAGLFFGADIALWHLAIVRTSLANATLLVNTTPLFVGLWLGAVRREQLGRRFWVSAALALAGATLLLGASPAGASAGDALALGAAVFYRGYLLLMKDARRGGDTVAVLALASAAAAALLGAAALVAGDPFTGFPPGSWAAIAGAARVAQIGGILGIVWALRWARASFAAVALLGQPLGTTLLGWWLFDEPLGAQQAAGAAAVLAAIVLAAGGALDPGEARR